MPLWGQNKQKVKVRSIFVEDKKGIVEQSTSQKAYLQIRETRNKTRANIHSNEKIDESVLDFRKNNETNHSERESVNNLNPLIVYEKNDLEVIEDVIIPPKIVEESKVKEVTESYQKFKEQNLTTKYKKKKVVNIFVAVVSISLLCTTLVGVSFWNLKKLNAKCGELYQKAQSFNIQEDYNHFCNSSKSFIYDLSTFGVGYSNQVNELETNINSFENVKAEETTDLKAKINGLNTLLGKKDLLVADTLAENKLHLERLTKEKEDKLSEFGNLLNKVKYLDEVTNDKKSLEEFNSFEKFSDSEKLQAIEVLKKRIDEMSKKLDPKKLSELLKFKYFSGDEWKNTFEKAKFTYENVSNENSPIKYFDDTKADEVAIKIAESRGFVRRPLVKDESQLYGFEGQKLQKPMFDALTELFKEMRANKLKIKIVSGFRGIEEQSQIFGEELKIVSKAEIAREFTTQEIIDHKADNAIIKVLETIALPGYSRHHFGYTVDLTEEGTDYKQFETTKSYEWMTKDNFYNIKKYGIIPSYPKGVANQGPEPESWEFVYVGIKNTLTNPEI